MRRRREINLKMAAQKRAAARSTTVAKVRRKVREEKPFTLEDLGPSAESQIPPSEILNFQHARKPQVTVRQNGRNEEPKTTTTPKKKKKEEDLEEGEVSTEDEEEIVVEDVDE